jgi:hypothetical protein
MSTQNVELTVNAAPNNRSIIAANNYGNQHNHYHSYGVGTAKHDASVQPRDRFFLSDPVIDRQVLQAAKGTIVPGTLDWIHKNAVYRAWLFGSSTIFWITGSPGKGKTMMAMSLAAQLQRDIASTSLADGHDLPLHRKPVGSAQTLPVHSPDADSHTVQRVYAFFSRKDDEKRNNAVAVLRGVIYQILSSKPTLMNVIKTEMEGDNKSTSALTSREALWLMLEKLIRNIRLPSAYCLLDGMDECDQESINLLRHKILALCVGSNSCTGAGRLQWLIISRDLGDIHGCARISLDDLKEEVDQNIKRVVAFTFDNMVSTVLDEDSKNRLRDGVLDGAGGTFLWAGYITHELSQRKAKKEILDLMQTLPKDLNALYDRMLHGILKKDQKMCGNLLQWVALALEPLDLADLTEALEIRSTQETTAREELDFWIERCGHILQVSGTSVSLVHQSARDYLLGSHAIDPGLTIFRVDTMEGHCDIASRCIGYLERSKITTYIMGSGRALDVMSLSALKRDRANCAFLAYALDHWVQHVQLASTKFSILEAKYSTFFNLKSGMCIRCIGCRRDRIDGRFPDYKHPMIVATEEGVLQWAKSIHARRRLKDLCHPLYRMKWKKDAMHTAVYKEYTDIVVWLLDIGFDVNATNDAASGFGLKRLPLVLHAFERRKYDIVELLVQRGALIHGKRVPQDSVQSLRRQCCDLAEIWFCILIERFEENPCIANYPWAAYEWTLHCIWMNKFSLVR